jgi:hypothetical protein
MNLFPRAQLLVNSSHGAAQSGDISHGVVEAVVQSEDNKGSLVVDDLPGGVLVSLDLPCLQLHMKAVFCRNERTPTVND